MTPTAGAIRSRPPAATPIAGEAYARKMAAERKQDEAWRRKMDEMQRQEEEARLAAIPPRWGIKEASRIELERVRRQVAENQAKRTGGTDDTV